MHTNMSPSTQRNNGASQAAPHQRTSTNHLVLQCHQEDRYLSLSIYEGLSREQCMALPWPIMKFCGNLSICFVLPQMGCNCSRGRKKKHVHRVHALGFDKASSSRRMDSLCPPLTLCWLGLRQQVPEQRKLS